MPMIIPALVSAHANSLLALIENSETCTLDVASPGTVEMDGRTARCYLTDGDAVYSLTLQPVPWTALFSTYGTPPDEAAVTTPVPVMVPNATYGEITQAELETRRANAHRCLACGMLADVDPVLHQARYGHRPKYRDDEGIVFAWFAGDGWVRTRPADDVKPGS
jgi:hypothetical protein